MNLRYFIKRKNILFVLQFRFRYSLSCEVSGFLINL